MKKIVFGFFAVVFIYSFCFAEGVTKTVSPTILHSKNFKGKIGSIQFSDPTAGLKSEITVTDEKGVTLRFIVTSGINISGKDGKILTLRKLNIGDTVDVEYTESKEGANRAIEIDVK